MAVLGTTVEKLTYFIKRSAQKLKPQQLEQGGLCTSKYCPFAKNNTAANQDTVTILNRKKAKRKAYSVEEMTKDKTLSIPVKIAREIRASAPATKFYESLKINKTQLMQALKLTSEEYDQYARLALKFAKEESSFALGLKYTLYDLAEKTAFGRKFISTIRKYLRGEDILSIGMTRFKISLANQTEKSLFEKFGITFDNNKSNITNPEKSAIATIIHIANLGKSYNAYINNIKKFVPDLGSIEVQNSIANAKRLLFNDKLRPEVIKAIKQGNNVNLENLQKMGVTVSDLEDLKTYAKTIILSKDAFIAAKWNGRKYIPNCPGNNNYAIANLLKLASQKGYIANIAPSNHIFY